MIDLLLVDGVRKHHLEEIALAVIPVRDGVLVLNLEGLVKVNLVT